ncbi:MAG: Gfo/Idh/MocA family oxidoreductase, partial [Dehalococcoidales bacterium]|nr:Gfo/Idh/MocA family oxidoreductase [Dehalococcoidales bacterium]
LGLVGCGGIARSAHHPAIRSLPGLVRLVAAADVSLAAAEAAAAPFGADAYANFRRVVERSDVDVVLVAAPEFAHREIVEAAAAARKHVLSEKPMAPSLEDADAMIAACRSAGVRLMIAHSRRFTRRYQKIREAIDAGEIGEVRLARENERRMRPLTGQTSSYWRPEHWTGDPQLSLGAALLNGIHEFDLLRWFIGTEPVKVFAEAAIQREGNRVPDFITFTATFANGAVGSAEITNSLPPGYPAYHQLDICGTRGLIRARDTDQQALIHFGDTGAHYPGTYERLLHIPDAYTSELADFVTALQGDRPVPLPPEESRAALQFALAAVRSAREGRPVGVATVATVAEGRI